MPDGAAASRRDLRRWAGAGPVDLARAALAIAREEYPELEDAPHLAFLDRLAAQVRAALPPGASPERKVGRLNAFLFHEQGFRGSPEDYQDPRSSFLNQVLERRSGIPITLSLVWLEVARRCGLDAHGVSFPGHFLCRAELGEGTLVVDPFARGKLLSLDELKRRFRAAAGGEASFGPAALRPASAREILVRMLRNLLQLYRRKGDLPRALSAVDRLLLLAPEDPRGLRDRAALCERLGGARAAAEDLEKVLRLEPAAADAEELRTRAHRLRAGARLLN